MSDSTFFLSSCVGAVLGGSHAALIYQAARAPSNGFLWGPLRLAIIGGFLYLAAKIGVLLSAALGWAVGFYVIVAIVAFWRTAWNRSKFSVTP